MTEKSGQGQPVRNDIAGKMFVGIHKRVATLLERPWPEIQKEIELKTAAIMNENAHRAIDEQSKRFLLPVSSLLLAAYRTLLTMIEDKEKLLMVLSEEVGEAMGGDMAKYLYDRFRIRQDAPGEALKMACENFKKIGEDRFGRTFVYEKDVQNESGCSFNVRKCFFDEFFRENGAPELMPVCCMQDNLWMTELNKPRYGLTVTRSSIISEGGDACRFHFAKRVGD